MARGGGGDREGCGENDCERDDDDEFNLHHDACSTHNAAVTARERVKSRLRSQGWELRERRMSDGVWEIYFSSSSSFLQTTVVLFSSLLFTFFPQLSVKFGTGL